MPLNGRTRMTEKDNRARVAGKGLFLAIVTVLALQSITCAANAAPHGQLDLVSMTAPELDHIADNVEHGRGPAELAADEPFVRFTSNEGFVDFQLDCHPEKKNYLTVKIWGGSGSGGDPGSTLLLHHPDEGDAPFDRDFFPFGYNPRHHPRRGEIYRQNTGNPLPGRFIYATYPIPLQMTRGNQTVRLRLVYEGPEPGPDVYRAYTHLEPFFEPPADEIQGNPFELGSARESVEGGASATERYAHWKAEANRGVRRAFDFQLYGDEWQGRIDEGTVPEWTWGAFLGRGGTFPGGPYAELEDEVERWGGWMIRQGDSSMMAAQYLEVFAYAYEGDWSDFQGDKEILERIAAAMDFYARAQSNSGGWQGPGMPGYDVNWGTWLGGPNRSDHSPPLEGGQRHFYNAFRIVYQDLEDAGLLDVHIDNDLNPDTPKLSRREAYAEMAERSSRLYEQNVERNRTIANQVIHNYIPLYYIWSSIRQFQPDKALSEERMIELAEIAGGIRRQPSSGGYMYSPRGMPLEGGYDGNYGGGGMHLVDLAELTRFPTIEEKVSRVFEAYAHFVYFDNDSTGHRILRNPEWISWRVMRGFPGREIRSYPYGDRYFVNRYAAEELNIPAARRYLELYQEHHPGQEPGLRIHDRITTLEDYRALNGLDLRTPPGLWSRIINAIEWTEMAMRDMEGATSGAPDWRPTDYRLPDEMEEDSAFVDEHNGLVALRHGNTRLIASLDWRSRTYPRNWLDGPTSGIVRLKHSTPTIQRLVTAKSMDSKGGPMDLRTMRYGPYFVVMNGSKETSFEYQVPEDMQGERATDLLTGEEETLNSRAVLPPFSSRVFVISKHDE